MVRTRQVSLHGVNGTRIRATERDILNKWMRKVERRHDRSMHSLRSRGTFVGGSSVRLEDESTRRDFQSKAETQE